MTFAHVTLHVTNIGHSIDFYSRLKLPVTRMMSTDNHS